MPDLLRNVCGFISDCRLIQDFLVFERFVSIVSETSCRKGLVERSSASGRLHVHVSIRRDDSNA